MPLSLTVYVLTAFATLVVVVTRRRLRAGGDRHGHGVSSLVLGVHTWAGLAAAVLWTVFLLLPYDGAVWHSLLGLAGLGLWWTTSWFGLLLLGRWLPSRGRHSDDRDAGWFVGLGLSLLGHLGLAASAVAFTWGYLTNAV
ncbi:hypothetical protein [Nocardioides alkalitolerans]|uniref:hypothetical protein n=1 Tax=Nocardioides alkalitolerans TaxID=281714 RepID=UPI00048C36B8|nr:hypothetical protein [Nocardioides alkalitolerans]